MNILEQKENKLLNREEILVELTSETIPSKIELKKQIADKLKKSEETIIIEKVNTQFGNHTLKVSAKVYDNVESKDKYETVSRKEKKKRAAEEKKAAEEKIKAEEEAKKAAEEAKTATEKPVEETPVENSDSSDSKIEEAKEEKTE